MNAKPIVLLVVGLVVGGALGYFYGVNSVMEVKLDSGIATKQEEGVSKNPESALPAEANPYAKIKDAANPFKDSSYQNPFAQ